MNGKEARTALKISSLSSQINVGDERELYVKISDPVAQPVDPIQQLYKNIDTLKSLTGELSFMVKEIGKLTSK